MLQRTVLNNEHNEPLQSEGFTADLPLQPFTRASQKASEQHRTSTSHLRPANLRTRPCGLFARRQTLFLTRVYLPSVEVPVPQCVDEPGHQPERVATESRDPVQLRNRAQRAQSTGSGSRGTQGQDTGPAGAFHELLMDLACVDWPEATLQHNMSSAWSDWFAFVNLHYCSPRSLRAECAGFCTSPSPIQHATLRSQVCTVHASYVSADSLLRCVTGQKSERARRLRSVLSSVQRHMRNAPRPAVARNSAKPCH